MMSEISLLPSDGTTQINTWMQKFLWVNFRFFDNWFPMIKTKTLLILTVDYILILTVILWWESDDLIKLIISLLSYQEMIRRVEILGSMGANLSDSNTG
jgi:hypothetical protein